MEGGGAMDEAAARRSRLYDAVQLAAVLDAMAARAAVLLADDVLYTGHSLLRAADYLARRRAPCVRAVVLAERCATQLPVHADVAGVRLQVAPGDIVECHVPPFEAALAIELVHRPAIAEGEAQGAR